LSNAGTFGLGDHFCGQRSNGLIQLFAGGIVFELFTAPSALFCVLTPIPTATYFDALEGNQ